MNTMLPVTINTMELEIAMKRKGVTSNDMSKSIKLSRVSFDKRRFGHIPFQANEICVIAAELSLTLKQVNDIFFDGNLHDGNL